MFTPETCYLLLYVANKEATIKSLIQTNGSSWLITSEQMILDDRTAAAAAVAVAVAYPEVAQGLCPKMKKKLEHSFLSLSNSACRQLP